MTADYEKLELKWKEIPGYDGFYASRCGFIKTPLGRVTRGAEHGEGYYVVRAAGNARLVHRLVALAYLENPDDKKFIDHLNRDRLDNRVENLRWVSASENQQNKTKRLNTTSLYMGVSWRKRNTCWHAAIHVAGKQQHIGYFQDEVQAARAYDAAARAAGYLHLNFQN